MAWHGHMSPSSPPSPRCHHRHTRPSSTTSSFQDSPRLLQIPTRLPSASLCPLLSSSLFTFNFTHHRRWCRCCTALHDAAFVSPSLAAPRQPHESARIVHTTCADCPEARGGCGADGGRALLAQAGVDGTQASTIASNAPPPRVGRSSHARHARTSPLARLVVRLLWSFFNRRRLRNTRALDAAGRSRHENAWPWAWRCRLR